jgi:D-3-phosphoglycerate dehydrogenase / 2-oxoglutarate reductase
MKPTVIIAYTDASDTKEEQEILKAIDANILYIRKFDTEEAFEAVSKADAFMVGLEEVRANLIARMDRCRIISRLGTGLDTIDIEAATERGILVTYVPDYSIDEVSAHAIALLMAQARRLPDLLEMTRQGIWNSSAVSPIQRLKDQILGVAGFGRIGQATAEKGRGLGLKVIAHDPYLDDQVIEAAGVQVVDWETLLRTSDYISLHTPLTDSTHHLVNAEALALMKPTAYLINTARGPLIDEDALLAAVRSGQIAGAALDVLTVEPPPPDHPLLHEKQIIITPHVAFYSEAAKRDLRIRGAEEVVRALKGEHPRSPANQIK